MMINILNAFYFIVISTLNGLTLIHRAFQLEVMILMLFLKIVLKMLSILYLVGKKCIVLDIFAKKFESI